MDNVILLMVTYFMIAVTAIITVLYINQSKQTKKYKQRLEKLDIQKNQIVNATVLTELSKVENLVKNKKLEEKYKIWDNKFKNIKESKLPKVSDMLLEADFLVEQKDYKEAMGKIAKIELEIEKLQNKSNVLYGEIQEVTQSEEKNRASITKLKAIYRELNSKFTRTKQDYGEIIKPITLQFENIERRFQEFEDLMENNEYEDVYQIVNALEDMIKNMSLVLEEVPAIILMGRNIIPKKISELTTQYSRMLRDEYSLSHLKVEYNIEEINKKVNMIFDKLKLLNIEDSIIELKTILEYFDKTFTAFDKEKECRKIFEDNLVAFKTKNNKNTKIIHDIYVGLDDIKSNYDLSEKDIYDLGVINQESNSINTDFQLLLDKVKVKSLAYSFLVEELDNLNNRLNKLETELETLLQSIGSLKDDETRAKEQLEDIKSLLKQAKNRFKDYKVPFLPDNYYTELKEAQEAIKEITKELDKKPINIRILNTRVDTARDLVFKLYNTTNEMIKTAYLAETTIMYGNRYRSNRLDIDAALTEAEVMFFEGKYRQSLEKSLNIINLIEPGIKQKLLKKYKEGK